MADLANLRISVDSREVRSATTDLNALGDAASKTEGKTDGLMGAFGNLKGVLSGLGFGLIAKEIITMADTFSSLQGRIALVTDSTEQLQAVQSELFNLAQQTRVGYESTVELYARLARSTENLGVSQRDVLQVTETINKALIVSGTSAQAASGSLMQLGQAFASGALRGDELNSVMEGMPRVAEAIAEGMGITVGQLRELGAQGKLTGAEVFAALQKMGDSVSKEFEQMPITVGQSFTVLNNSLMQFVGEINAATGFTEKLAKVIIFLANNLDVLAVAGAAASVAFAAIKAQLVVTNIVAYTRSIVALEIALGAGGTASALFSAGLKMVQGAFMSLTATMMANPFVAVATAIAAVTSLLYANRDAQIQLGGDTVRLGDIFLGVFEMINRAVSFVTQIFREGWAAALGSVSPKLTALGEAFDTVFKWLSGYIQAWVNLNIGFFVGMWRGIKAVFTDESVVDAFRSAFGVNYIGAAIGTVTSGLKSLADIGAKVRKVGETAEVSSVRSVAAVARVSDAAKAKNNDAEKAANEAIKRSEEYVKALEKETQNIGKTAIEIKRAEIAAAAAAAPTKEWADSIKKAGQAYIEASEAFEANEKREQANKDIDETIKALEDEYKLLGLTGEARDRAALALEREGFIAKYKTALGIKEATAAWERYAAAKGNIITGESALANDVKEAEKLQDIFYQLIDLVDRLFKGAGSFLVNLGRDIKIVAPDFIKGLENVFEGFLGALPTVLANARIGMAVGGGTGGAVGGMIGGALGKKLLGDAMGNFGTKIGGKVFGDALGSLAGPLGSIAGGLLGGLVGGLLKKTKTGSATLSQVAGGAMQKTMSGNSAQLKGVADKLAGGLLKGLGDIAEQLGGTLGGAVKLSIGQRNKNFVVDPTGAGRTKGAGVMNFGQDQAAAVAYVTQLAIQQGIVTGISAGAQTLIRAGDDLNAQVQKALKFDQVFKDLLKETDPLNASVSELSAEMEKLKAIFKEAGATAEDYAKLEELFALRQAKAIFEANKPRRELEIQLMEAQGKAVDALAARRQLELESMDANLRALQQQVWAAEDAAKATEELADANAKAAEEAAAAVEAAKALALERRSLEIDLMEALGRSSEALAARRQMELDAMDASLRGLQAQIWAELDAKQAAEEAAAAQAKAAEDAANAMQKYMDALTDVTKTVTDEINRLRGINASSTSAMLKAQFATLTAQARTGNLDALAKLPELSRSIEEATLGSAGSALEVARIRAWLSASLSETLAAQAVTNADINTVGAGVIFDGNQTVSSNGAQTADAVNNMRNEMYNVMYQIAKNTGKSYELMDRWDGDGLPDIREDASDYY